MATINPKCNVYFSINSPTEWRRYKSLVPLSKAQAILASINDKLPKAQLASFYWAIVDTNGALLQYSTNKPPLHLLTSIINSD